MSNLRNLVIDKSAKGGTGNQYEEKDIPVTVPSHGDYLM